MLKTNKNKKVKLLLLILLIITVGYALLSTTLKINGYANIKANTWDIYWDENSISMVEGSVTGTPTVDETKQNLLYSINLKQPGDYYEFTIDAVNNGTIDGMISINDFTPVVKDENKQTINLPSYLKYELTYADGNQIEKNHKLSKKSGNTPTREKYKIKVEFDKNTNTLPSTQETITVESSVPYNQADDEAREREKHQLATYTITFDAKGGTVSPSTKQVEENGRYGQLPTPTKTGYTFIGWYINDEKITSKDEVKITKNETFEARYLRNEYTITFNANGGEVTPTTKKVLGADTIGELPVPTRENYAFLGWYTGITDGVQITSSTIPSNSSTYYAHWIYGAKCNAGEYLPQSSFTCDGCIAGNYCPGGIYEYNTEQKQGMTACAEGSYSTANSSTCTACGDGTTTYGSGQTRCNYTCSNYKGANTWATVTWNSNNTVSNLCKIESCKNITIGAYVLDSNNNECIVNITSGTMYSFRFPNNIEKNKDISDEYLYHQGYIYIKSEIVNNIVHNRYICFNIKSEMNIAGANNGEYCLKAPDNEDTYQDNVAVLKSAFGNNHPNCTETSDKFVCKYTTAVNHDSYEYFVTKAGEIYAFYDQPITTNKIMGNPECRLNGEETPLYVKPNHCENGCLDGETEVEVYDRKKKKKYRKKLKDVTPDDLILCWDFDTGKLVFIEPLWIKKEEIVDHYYLLEFSDGSYLKIIGDHKLFDIDRNKFVNAGAENELEIGSHVFNSNGEILELVSWKRVEETVESYNVITNRHMNLFANGILTSCVFSNIYSIENMKYVKNEYERLSNEDLDGIDEKYISGLRLNEVPTNFRGNKETTISYIKQYIQNLISKEK